jgi:molybdopterin-guanine dinucleotide biosynthesis protein A
MVSDSIQRNIAGVILAGGRSSRMGKDKAMLEVGGMTLFDRVLQMMRGLFDEILIAEDRNNLIRPGIGCHTDLYTGSSLGGLYTGLMRSSRDMVFVCPCDMPFPNMAIAQFIAAQDPEYDVVVPKTPKGTESLFARYHKRCLPFMKDMLERGEFRIANFYPLARMRYVDASELPPWWQISFLNINTPEEYRRIKESADLATSDPCPTGRVIPARFP